mmetsp:Transcript_94833/g.305191  ORF Transcript_94833/g.305191 Transcript_94833/m.305191 type:complete len:276 (+) Transcript_94833:2-829(+)
MVSFCGEVSTQECAQQCRWRSELTKPVFMGSMRAGPPFTKNAQAVLEPKGLRASPCILAASRASQCAVAAGPCRCTASGAAPPRKALCAIRAPQPGGAAGGGRREVVEALTVRPPELKRLSPKHPLEDSGLPWPASARGTSGLLRLQPRCEKGRCKFAKSPKSPGSAGKVTSASWAALPIVIAASNASKCLNAGSSLKSRPQSMATAGTATFEKGSRPSPPTAPCKREGGCRAVSVASSWFSRGRRLRANRSAKRPGPLGGRSGGGAGGASRLLD